MVSTRRGPLLECRWRTVGSDFPRGVWCWMTAWEKQNESPFGTLGAWLLGWPPGRPITGVRVLLPHRPSPDRDYGKFTDATPPSRVVLAFFSMWGLRAALRLQRAASRAAACGQLDARLTPRPVFLFEEWEGGWISALDRTPCSLLLPHVALGPMATDLRWHRPGVPF